MSAWYLRIYVFYLNFVSKILDIYSKRVKKLSLIFGSGSDFVPEGIVWSNGGHKLHTLPDVTRPEG